MGEKKGRERKDKMSVKENLDNVLKCMSENWEEKSRLENQRIDKQ